MKKKILCLHGYSMNGAWLEEWFSQLEDALGEPVCFIYPDAPIECSESQVRYVWSALKIPPPEKRLGPGKNFCWYRASDQTPPSYKHIDLSLEMLARLTTEQGPFDGIIGWSQGAMLAAIILGEMEYSENARFHFNWAVLCAGAMPTDPRFEHYFNETLSVPMLQIVGTKEPFKMQERYQQLFHVFKHGQRINTPVGHVMPLKHPDYMKKITDWIKQHLEMN